MGLAGIGNQGFGIEGASSQPASCEDAGGAANIKFCLMPAWLPEIYPDPHQRSHSSFLIPHASHPPCRGQCDFEYLAY